MYSPLFNIYTLFLLGLARFFYDVAPCKTCRPWIFFINRVLFFLKINDNRMEKEER